MSNTFTFVARVISCRIVLISAVVPFLVALKTSSLLFRRSYLCQSSHVDLSPFSVPVYPPLLGFWQCPVHDWVSDQCPSLAASVGVELTCTCQLPGLGSPHQGCPSHSCQLVDTTFSIHTQAAWFLTVKCAEKNPQSYTTFSYDQPCNRHFMLAHHCKDRSLITIVQDLSWMQLPRRCSYVSCQ